MPVEGAGDSITELAVDLGARSYAIHIGPGLLHDIGARCKEIARGSTAFIVSDENVAPLYLTPVSEALRGAGLTPVPIVLAPGEAAKSFEQLAVLVGDLLDAGMDRSALIVALGGGVIGDLAGFAAAIVMRGVDYVQVPTTLLSQVDSSVGGKTAIDMPQGKNLVGSFHQPRLVIADSSTLDSLPRRELLAGYGEVVKYAVLGDAEFFAWLEANGAAALAEDGPERTEMIARCCAMKADIVSRDERECEGGVRARLNLGHTFAHAFEVEAGFDGRLLHGEAVAIGMCMAYRLSIELGHAGDGDFERLRAHFAALDVPTEPPRRWADGRTADWDVDRLLNAMRLDKKARGGMPAFVLPRGLGDAFVCRDVPLDRVAALLTRAVAD